ncbi:extensin-like domain-containing protein [Azotobacter salinestris]|uniref:extensin-like domain-containing protein n=1 Tax=Azotobacter salinestris TaxID=69964 RepID=UPI001AD70496|nr:extensin family protein [Azotobacter salinestris]
MPFVRWLLMCALLAGIVWIGWQAWPAVPPRWSPWAPLDVRDPPNLLTPFKQWRLRHDPALCAAALASSALRYTALADSRPAPDCPIENSVRLYSAEVAFNASLTVTCPLAVGYALFERHGLQPAARQVFGQPVVRIDHYGSFACRNIARSARRSQHASANALDIAGFRLGDGRRITVARDWGGDDEAARFLRLVRDAACRFFNVALGPDYNAAHRDHLHVDMGPGRLCR